MDGMASIWVENLHSGMASIWLGMTSFGLIFVVKKFEAHLLLFIGLFAPRRRGLGDKLN
jgi:hypothetical protein